MKNGENTKIVEFDYWNT